MAFEYGFYDAIEGDRKYTARDFGKLFDGLISDGIFEEIGNKFFTTCTGTDMKVSVGTGKAWFNHTYSLNTSPMVFALSASHPVMGRYDAIVLEVNDEPVVDGRKNEIKLIEGTVSSNPEKPTLVNSTFIHQYPLAYIKINAGVEAIVAGNIEIMVGQDPCPFVTGIVETADITDLFAAWNNQFTTWFDNLKSQLSGDVVANIQNQLDTLSTSIDAVDEKVDDQKNRIDTIDNQIEETAPIGSILFLASAVSSIPGSYLLANGALINRAQYLSLFNVIGTKYGSEYGPESIQIGFRNDVYDLPSDFETNMAKKIGKNFVHVPNVGWVNISAGSGQMLVYKPYKNVEIHDISTSISPTVTTGAISAPSLIAIQNSSTTYISFETSTSSSPNINTYTNSFYSSSNSYTPNGVYPDICSVCSTTSDNPSWYTCLMGGTKYQQVIYSITSGVYRRACGIVNPGGSSDYWNNWPIIATSSGLITVAPKGTGGSAYPILSGDTTTGSYTSGISYSWGTSRTTTIPTVNSGVYNAYPNRGTAYDKNTNMWWGSVTDSSNTYLTKMVNFSNSSPYSTKWAELSTNTSPGIYGPTVSCIHTYAQLDGSYAMVFYINNGSSNTRPLVFVKSTLTSDPPTGSNNHIEGSTFNSSVGVMLDCSNVSDKTYPLTSKGYALTNLLIQPNKFKLPTISLTNCKACIKYKM